MMFHKTEEKNLWKVVKIYVFCLLCMITQQIIVPCFYTSYLGVIQNFNFYTQFTILRFQEYLSHYLPDYYTSVFLFCRVVKDIDVYCCVSQSTSYSVCT